MSKSPGKVTAVKVNVKVKPLPTVSALTGHMLVTEEQSKRLESLVFNESRARAGFLLALGEDRTAACPFPSAREEPISRQKNPLGKTGQRIITRGPEGAAITSPPPVLTYVDTSRGGAPSVRTPAFSARTPGSVRTPSSSRTPLTPSSYLSPTAREEMLRLEEQNRILKMKLQDAEKQLELRGLTVPPDA